MKKTMTATPMTAMSRIAPRDYKETVIPKMTVNNKSISSNKSIPNFNSPASSTQNVVESKSYIGPRRTTMIRTVEPPSSSYMNGSKRRNHFRFKTGNLGNLDSPTLSGFEVQRLARRFEKLDADNSGTLSIEEFMNLTELQDNHLAHRVISLFDQDKNGEVDFKEFIEGISVFSLNADRDNKLRFAFRIYDIDNDGYISNSDLFTVLQLMVGNNLKDNQLQEIVDRTILYADTDEDGKISYTEFCAVIGNVSDVDRTILDIVVDV